MDEEGKEEKWDRREEEEVLRVVKYISWGGLRRVLDQRGSSATVGSKSVSSVGATCAGHVRSWSWKVSCPYISVVIRNTVRI